uniref:hypothetical protein n=1 Tax=Ningiella ruwaisensis TaxID=2364274 RepID=UPI00109FFB7A|nr:hypothetical protein [Ningiella ruwaisensis]
MTEIIKGFSAAQTVYENRQPQEVQEFNFNDTHVCKAVNDLERGLKIHGISYHDVVEAFTDDSLGGNSAIGMPDIANKLNFYHLRGDDDLANKIRTKWFGIFIFQYAHDLLAENGYPKEWKE